MKKRLSQRTGLYLLFFVAYWIICVTFAYAGTDGQELVGYWKLDERKGDVIVDSSGHTNNGKLYGGRWLKTQAGYILSFDGKDDYVEVFCSNVRLAVKDKMTIAVWIYPRKTNGWQFIVGGRSAGDRYQERYSLRLNSNALVFWLQAGDKIWEFKTAEQSVVRSRWQHVAATWDGSDTKLYVDGGPRDLSSVCSENDTGGSFLGANGMIRIGMGDKSRADYFRGAIREVKVYSELLFENQIREIYENTRQKMEKAVPVPKVLGKSFAILAHRGSLMLAPGNTLPAFAIALGLGTDFELDVYMTKDGHLVVIHDPKVGRTADGSGKVTEKTLAELRALDAGHWFNPAFAQVHIPTLEEVLQLIKDFKRPEATIALNMKTAGRGIEQKIVNLVEKYEMVSQVFAFGMTLESAKRFKASNPAFLTAVSVRDKDNAIITVYEEEPLSLDAVLSLPYIDCIWAWEIERRWITSEVVAKVHNQGKKIYSSMMCIDGPSEWERLIEAGVDGMCVDDAVKLRKLLDSKYWAYDAGAKWARESKPK